MTRVDFFSSPLSSQIIVMKFEIGPHTSEQRVAAGFQDNVQDCSGRRWGNRGLEGLYIGTMGLGLVLGCDQGLGLGF